MIIKKKDIIPNIRPKFAVSVGSLDDYEQEAKVKDQTRTFEQNCNSGTMSFMKFAKAKEEGNKLNDSFLSSNMSDSSYCSSNKDKEEKDVNTECTE